MYLETSGNNYNGSNDNVFVSFERTHIIHISNMTFYHNRFSTSKPNKRGMGILEVQLIINGSWETEFTIEEDKNFSTLSTDWTFLNMNIVSQPNYGKKVFCSGVNISHADMVFSEFNITQTIFQTLT